MPANYFRDRENAYNAAIEHLNPHEMMCIAVAARALRKLTRTLAAQEIKTTGIDNILNTGHILEPFADMCGHRFDQIQEEKQSNNVARALATVDATRNYIGGILEDFFNDRDNPEPATPLPTEPCGDDCVCLDLVDEEATEQDVEKAADEYDIVRYADLVAENQRLKRELEASKNRPNIYSIHPSWPQPHVKPLYWHGAPPTGPKVMSGGISLASDPTISSY